MCTTFLERRVLCVYQAKEAPLLVRNSIKFETYVFTVSSTVVICIVSIGHVITEVEIQIFFLIFTSQK